MDILSNMFGSVERVFDRSKNISVIAGEPRSAIMFLFWPLFLSYIVVAINGYLDAFWVSTLGSESSSAVNSMLDIYLSIASIGAGVGVACAVTISFHLGRNDYGRADSIAAHALLICLLASVVLGIVMTILSGQLIHIMGIEDIKPLCMDYITPLIVCNIAILINGALCGVLRAEGAAAKSTVAVLLSVTSAIFNPIFIIGLDMGVSGAAWGTIAGIAVSTAYLSYLFATNKTVVKIRLRNFRISIPAIKEQLAIGIPYSIQTTARKFSHMLENSIVMFVAGAVYGSAAIFIFTIPWIYVFLQECIGLAIGAAMMPVMSYNIGRMDKTKAGVSFSFSIRRALLPSILLCLGIAVFSDPLVGLFTTEPSVAQYQDILAMYLILIAVTGPFFTIRDICNDALQTMRRNNLCMLLVFLHTGLKLIAMFICGIALGLEGMMAANVISNCIGCSISIAAAHICWKRFDVADIVVTDTQNRMMDELEDMEKEQESGAKDSHTS